jgi:hypothetical protein
MTINFPLRPSRLCGRYSEIGCGFAARGSTAVYCAFQASLELRLSLHKLFRALGRLMTAILFLQRCCAKLARHERR